MPGVPFLSFWSTGGPEGTASVDGSAETSYVRSPDGTLRSFGSVSPLTDALNRQLRFRRIHIAPQYRDLAQIAVMAR